MSSRFGSKSQLRRRSERRAHPAALHPEVWPCDQRRPLPSFPLPFRYWLIRGGRGLVLHAFYTTTALLDFSAVSASHTDCLDRDLFENIYLRQNFADNDRIYIIQDS